MANILTLARRYPAEEVGNLYKTGLSIHEVVQALHGKSWDEPYVSEIVKSLGIMRNQHETMMNTLSRGRIHRPHGVEHYKFKGYQYEKCSAGHHHKVRPGGYILVYMGKGQYVRRNRLVWETANGPIPEGCEIHHLNGIKDDDRIENLACLSKAGHARISLRILEQAQKRIRELEGQLKKQKHQLKFDLGK